MARHRIYNWNTYPGIVLGIAVNTFQTGMDGFQSALAGFLVCGLIMLFCFVLFNVGGGDVKLIAMMAAFLGLHDGIEAMLWTFVLGGLMGTVYLIWHFGAWGILTKAVRHLWLVMRARSWIPLDEEEREPLGRWLFLAPSALAAVCIIAARHLW